MSVYGRRDDDVTALSPSGPSGRGRQGGSWEFPQPLTRCFRQWWQSSQLRLSPLLQRTGSPSQRALSPSDHQKATRLSREMALFTRLQGGATAAPKLAPGTPAFSSAAQKDYADLLDLHQAPRLPAAFVVQKLETLPAPVRAAFDTFRKLHGGRAEVALSTIDGHRTWQAQVVQTGGAQVLLLDGKGSELARGVVRGAAVSWRR